MSMAAACLANQLFEALVVFELRSFLSILIARSRMVLIPVNGSQWSAEQQQKGIKQKKGARRAVRGVQWQRGPGPTTFVCPHQMRVWLQAGATYQ